MTLFVHIAPENRAAVIRRTGIAPTRWRPDPSAHPEWDRAVWAFPVLPSYTLTHSWARELKRSGRSTLAAIAFRVPDDEARFARHYRERVFARMRAAGMVRPN